MSAQSNSARSQTGGGHLHASVQQRRVHIKAIGTPARGAPCKHQPRTPAPSSSAARPHAAHRRPGGGWRPAVHAEHRPTPPCAARALTTRSDHATTARILTVALSCYRTFADTHSRLPACRRALTQASPCTLSSHSPATQLAAELHTASPATAQHAGSRL